MRVGSAGHSGGGGAAATALAKFSRPLLAFRPLRPGTRSTVFIRCVLICSPVHAGLPAFTKAAGPDTNGVAIEVPLSSPYWLLGSVLWILDPGEAISTLVLPKFEKLDFASVCSVDMTEITLGTS